MSILAVEHLEKSYSRLSGGQGRQFLAARRARCWRSSDPNGAGKSTCFNMINGQLGADRRVVSVCSAAT